MLAWAKKATSFAGELRETLGLGPKKSPKRYGILRRTDGIVRSFRGVTAHGYRQDLGGSFFYVEHDGGSYEVAAEKLEEFDERDQHDDEDEDDGSSPHPSELGMGEGD